MGEDDTNISEQIRMILFDSHNAVLFATRDNLDTLPCGGAGEPAARRPTPPEGLARWLSPGDVNALSEYIRELAVQAIIPHLEARIRRLNAQVCWVLCCECMWALLGSDQGDVVGNSENHKFFRIPARMACPSDAVGRRP